MKEKKWVQHISGQGEKWEVDGSAEVTPCEWCVKSKLGGVRGGVHWLPKSEYVECEGPEEWEDVTERITESECKGNWKYGHMDVVGTDGGYRLRKVKLYGCEPQWAFIIERKK
jgi:hypothetical protein